jgi:hypothetical protein
MVGLDWLTDALPRLMCHERKRDHGIWDALLTTNREGETSNPPVFP